MFLSLVVVMISIFRLMIIMVLFNTIDRPLISYTKIQSKKGIMQYKVLIFNINLTFEFLMKNCISPSMIRCLLFKIIGPSVYFDKITHYLEIQT